MPTPGPIFNIISGHSLIMIGAYYLRRADLQHASFIYTGFSMPQPFDASLLIIIFAYLQRFTSLSVATGFWHCFISRRLAGNSGLRFAYQRLYTLRRPPIILAAAIHLTIPSIILSIASSARALIFSIFQPHLHTIVFDADSFFLGLHFEIFDSHLSFINWAILHTA